MNIFRRRGPNNILPLMCFMWCSLVGGVRAEEVLKFATLAPEGSTWVNVLRELDKEVREKTQGNVKFRIYAGGVSGDEKDVLRKIRLGQLQGAGFTGVGLGEILPEVRVLDTPFLFATTEEVDKVEKVFFDHFDKAFQKKGYVLLGWADVGFVYFLSQAKISSQKDLFKVKAWTWEGDPVAQELYKAAQISPIPLSIPDVLTSLQTGLIDTVYASPLAAVALQWFTKVKNMMDLPVTHAMGAVLVSKPFYNRLNKEDQAILRQVAKKYLEKLNQKTREDQKAARVTLKKEGIAFQSVAKQDALAFQVLGEKVQQQLADKLYPKILLDEIKKTISQAR